MIHGNWDALHQMTLENFKLFKPMYEDTWFDKLKEARKIVAEIKNFTVKFLDPFCGEDESLWAEECFYRHQLGYETHERIVHVAKTSSRCRVEIYGIKDYTEKKENKMVAKLAERPKAKEGSEQVFWRLEIKACQLIEIANTLKMVDDEFDKMEKPNENTKPNSSECPIPNYSKEIEFVDLDLPSGKKWMKCNLGSTKEEGIGDYYLFGAITPCTNDTCCDWEHAPFPKSFLQHYVDFITKEDGTLVDDFDVVYQVTNGAAHLPTREDFAELENNTNVESAVLNGVKGLKFTSLKDPKKYLFMPFSGMRSEDRIRWDFNSRGYYHVNEIFSSSCIAETFYIKMYSDAYGCHVLCEKEFLPANDEGPCSAYCVRGVMNP